MKETIKINLNQRLFDLDADAYEKLKQYLDSLRNIFQKTPNEADEILQDIEQRIAEILEEKLKSSKQVVTLSDIDEVILMMGTAEDFARDAEMNNDNEDYQQSSKSRSNAEFDRQHRRLYRDIENNIIGGVCSGLASYFNIDPVWIRLAFIALLFFEGLGFIAYIILWIAVPGARTTAQKLQMKGKAVTIENIQQSVKREFIKVKDNLNNFSKSESYKRTQQAAADTFKTIGNVLLVFFKVILIIVGVALAIAGVALIIGLIVSLMAGGLFFDWNFQYQPWQEFLSPFTGSFSLFGVALSLVILIPVAALLIGIGKLIFNVKSHNPVLSAFGWTFWILALVFVIVNVISSERSVPYSYGYEEYKTIDIPSGKVLYIDLNESMQTRDGIEYYSFFGKEILHNEYSDACLLRPVLQIKPSGNDEVKLMIGYTAVIPAFEEDYLEELYYHWYLNDTVLLLDDYFSIDEDHIWHLPGMKLTLLIPDKQQIVLDSELGRLVNNETKDSPGQVWGYDDRMIMRDGKLEPVEN
jgi:phage shock protein PspC (stress-responsive transcriptional regulator)